ncbi:hypothetical protein B0H10DRAFT_2237201 [Mycena sp. CBHHK59/15]|nr:hypothetical protein B0H10DRAFT_2237201 [Mycena sp. CBHHK59/15]
MKKRKSGGGSANSPDGKKTFNFTKDYRLSKSHLACAMHKGELCWVSNVDGHHHQVDREHTSLWAKEIENVGLDDIRYLEVTSILQQIDDSGIFEDSAALLFPAVVFADALHDSQITHVNHVPVLDTDFYVQVVNMPIELAELFVAESITAMGRAEKGKAPA